MAHAGQYIIKVPEWIADCKWAYVLKGYYWNCDFIHVGEYMDPTLRLLALEKGLDEAAPNFKPDDIVRKIWGYYCKCHELTFPRQFETKYWESFPYLTLKEDHIVCSEIRNHKRKLVFCCEVCGRKVAEYSAIRMHGIYVRSSLLRAIHFDHEVPKRGSDEEPKRDVRKKHQGLNLRKRRRHPTGTLSDSESE